MNGVLSEKGTRTGSLKTACFDERNVSRTRRPKPPPKRHGRLLTDQPFTLTG